MPGLGTLVPEDTRWLPATTEWTRRTHPAPPWRHGASESVILELSNPQVEQEMLNARLALQSAEATLENLRAQLQNDLLTQQAQVASIEADYKQAQMDAEANDTLAKQKLVLRAWCCDSRNSRADTFRTRFEIETKRLVMASESIDARTRVQQAAVDQARAIVDLHRSRLAELQVRPGFDGRPAAGASRCRPAGCARPEPGPSRRSATSEGRAADRGDAGKRRRTGTTRTG